MSRGVNKAIIVGNVGQDPEVRFLPSGDPVANFSLATSEQWTDKQSGQKQEKTEWHKCTAFGKLAEIIQQYVKKGSRLYVEGSLQTRKWQAQDGSDRYSTEIKVRDMQMLGGNEGGQPGGGQKRQEDYRGHPGSNQPNPTYQQGAQGPTPDDFNDEIPFAAMHNMMGG